MDSEEWNLVKDVMFLHDSGISLEKISQVKKISLERTKEIVGNRKLIIKRQNKKNVVQEIGNQNKWKDKLPEEEILKQMVENLEAEERHDGARTVPSRPINTVDRSDRVGEDRKMNDRLAAMEASADAPKALKDIVKSATIAQRKRDREEWENVQNSISELLDDDLES